MTRSWAEPIRCDVNATGAHDLLVSGKIRPCTACEPNMQRESDGSGVCRPKTIACENDKFSVTQLILETWEEWPKNMTQQVITAGGEEQGNVDRAPVSLRQVLRQPSGRPWLRM
eukprot:Skav232987  [mRNA]  locus=scaffold1735:608451:614853:+ [translate_table: standard]